MKNEFAKLKGDIQTLSDTIGFQKLSSVQKRIIIASLYIYNRSIREKGEDSSAYFLCQYIVRYWFCHSAIMSLENEDLSEDYLLGVPDSFSQTTYSKHLITLHEHAISLINQIGFPCVVHLSSREKVVGGLVLRHSFLALGYSNHGDILIWEKEGSRLPFRISNLKTILDYYDKQHWGVRKLLTRAYSV